MAASKKRRTSAKTQATDDFKRSRVSVSPDAQPVKYERIAQVPFPSQILALPHVLERIDTLLMEPAEAARAAVTTGQVKWLRQIISRFGNSVASADMLVVAASKGYQTVVELLLPALSTSRDQVYWKVLPPAMVAAGKDGQLGVLKLLLEELKMDNIWRNRDRSEICIEVGKVFGETLEGGHLDVVMFLVLHATEKGYARAFGKRSLSRAITGGHTAVIEFLLRVDGFDWDLPHALATAVDMKQTALAMQIYDGHRVYMGGNLFVGLARQGYTDAVEFLYPTVSNDVELLNAALLAAAEKDKSEVAASLIATKRVSSDTIAQSFVVAARRERSTLVQYLLANHELSPETIGAAFVSAAECHQHSLMQTLDDRHQVSAEFVLQAFNTTSWSSDLQALKYLAGLISDEARIPPEFKYKAFVSAATRGESKPMQQLTKRGSAELPLEVLRDAHEATREVKVKKLIYKVAYEQLFDPNVKGRFDAVAKLVAEWKEEPTGKKSRGKRKSK